MPFQLPDGRTLALDTPFTWNGVQYPANWLRLSTPDEKQTLGILELADPPAPPDQRFYWGWDENGNAIPKQLDDSTTEDEQGNTITTTGLKTQWKATTAQTANSLLAPTDWYVVRETDTGVPCPAEVRSWRQAIREASAAKAAAINACTTTDELAAYLTSGGVAVEDPETGEITIDSSNAYGTWPTLPAVEQQDAVDYRAFYDALLISPAYAAIRAKAVSSAPVLAACVEFIAAIGDAKSGRPNQAAIQACVDLLCAAAQFTAEELGALAQVMAVGGLDQVYTLPV